MRPKFLASTLFLVILSLAIICAVPRSFATPNIYIYPSVATGEPGATFDIEVRISSAADVFGWEFQLGWNASVLTFTRIVEGSFLKGIEQRETMFVNKTYQDEIDNDTIAAGCTRLGYVSGVDGSGTLARVSFVVENKGETVLELFQTKLVDSRPTPYPIEHTATSGLFSNIAGFPYASFTYAPSVVNINETMVFDASASYDADGSVVAYSWDFGDGQNASETTPFTSHAFSEGGTYPVSLTVTDNEGWNSSVTEEVQVRFAHNVAVGSISLSAESVTVGDTVTITVVVMNEGAETESPTTRVFYDSQEAATAQTTSNLLSGLNRTLTFQWDTGGVTPGDYRIKAVVDQVPSEGDTSDNTKLGRTVTLTGVAELPWVQIGLGVVVVIVIVLLAVYFLRRRGKGVSQP